MLWWLWFLLGLALLAFEILTPGGFYVLFFGIGALVVGIMDGLGLAGPEWAQWLLFSALSIGSMLLFRGRLIARIKSSAPTGPAVDTMIGETATLLDDLAPGGVGKAELRGTSWTVHNAAQQQLAKGQRCRVARVDGLHLWVQAE